MPRVSRYQGAIVRDHHILLIKHRHHRDGREYWLVPGGGREPGESEEACVRREMKEETNLEVRVERLLFEVPAPRPYGIYQSFKTYLCVPVGGTAQPGYEPEPDAAQSYAISEVGWFDLRDETGWEPLVFEDPITYPLVQRIREALGY